MSELKMPAINQVALSGRLVQDPEFRFVENGVARLSARLAVNRSYRDRDGEWREEASFFNMVAWHKLAEFAAERIHKGTPVFVAGRLRSHSWKDEDETPHTLVEIQVRSLQLLEKQTEKPVHAVDEAGLGEVELEEA
ncbi:MAG: single-stranded DNA-binding protein [Gemmatimonadetes bacterium]|nr:single-stranded DNA-binding protein [Gemmatimonadota bacterium]